MNTALVKFFQALFVLVLAYWEVVKAIANLELEFLKMVAELVGKLLDRYNGSSPWVVKMFAANEYNKTQLAKLSNLEVFS